MDVSFPSLFTGCVVCGGNFYPIIFPTHFILICSVDHNMKWKMTARIGRATGKMKSMEQVKTNKQTEKKILRATHINGGQRQTITTTINTTDAHRKNASRIKINRQYWIEILESISLALSLSHSLSLLFFGHFSVDSMVVRAVGCRRLFSPMLRTWTSSGVTMCELTQMLLYHNRSLPELRAILLLHLFFMRFHVYKIHANNIFLFCMRCVFFSSSFSSFHSPGDWVAWKCVFCFLLIFIRVLSRTIGDSRWWWWWFDVVCKCANQTILKWHTECLASVAVC